jgi:hypothetical protein
LIAHFTVHAYSDDHAIDIVRHSSLGGRYSRFEVIEETGEFEADEPGILAEGRRTVR